VVRGDAAAETARRWRPARGFGLERRALDRCRHGSEETSPLPWRALVVSSTDEERYRVVAFSDAVPLARVRAAASVEGDLATVEGLGRGEPLRPRAFRTVGAPVQR
jgi:hypothetical protein